MDTSDPLNPSNKGRNPRVVDAKGNVISFPLKASGAQLYYGNGQPMRIPQGALVRATGSVRLNYGMRLERGGQTYFMAWQTNHDDPANSGQKNATGWVAADDMTEEGAAAAKAAIARRLGNARGRSQEMPAANLRSFIVNGNNEQAKAAVALELAYIGVTGKHRTPLIKPDLRGAGVGNHPGLPGPRSP